MKKIPDKSPTSSNDSVIQATETEIFNPVREIEAKVRQIVSKHHSKCKSLPLVSTYSEMIKQREEERKLFLKEEMKQIEKKKVQLPGQRKFEKKVTESFAKKCTEKSIIKKMRERNSSEPNPSSKQSFTPSETPKSYRVLSSTKLGLSQNYSRLHTIIKQMYKLKEMMLEHFDLALYKKSRSIPLFKAAYDTMESILQQYLEYATTKNFSLLRKEETIQYLTPTELKLKLKPSDQKNDESIDDSKEKEDILKYAAGHKVNMFFVGDSYYAIPETIKPRDGPKDSCDLPFITQFEQDATRSRIGWLSKLSKEIKSFPPLNNYDVFFEFRKIYSSVAERLCKKLEME
ncbi:hypothetical protein ADUPG1_008931 [Aduncisulcus paluster]|uniref:Uncharacterized protein n=1 Tax=Aduncisulcus paluster TaxID=2918883 RepID=A0ABQ5KTT0_9EUKA|nr:hypothetical protein ADUPG1_008931 [Aduncisulcus paluster]